MFYFKINFLTLMYMSQQVSSKFISLVPTNGTEFDCNLGQKVIFELQPSLGLVKGRDSYLCLDILNSSSDQKRYGLQHSAGADSIIDRVDIYSLRTGQHLETMANYNQVMSMANQYFFEDKTNLQSLQGVGAETNVNSGGSPTKCLAQDINNNQISPVDAAGNPQYNFRRFTVPLKAGIFRYWDEERLCNVMGLQGLRIEITLASPQESCFQLEATDGTAGTVDLVTTGITVNDLAGAGTVLTTTNAMTVNGCGLAVGNQVVTTSNVADGNTTIAALSPNGGDATKLDITLTNAQAISTGIRVKVRNDTRALKVRPEFKVLSVAPPQSLISEMGNGFNYEFTSYDHFVDSLPLNARKHLIELNSVASRAVCVMTQFSDVTKLGGLENSSRYFGENPDNLKLNSVQYFLKNRLVPVRDYNPQVTSEKIVAINELMKALSSINKEPKDLGNFDGANADNYTNVFTIGRQLARDPYYYDLGNAEGQIRLGFSAARTNDTLCDTFVWSRKIASVSDSGGVQIIL